MTDKTTDFVIPAEAREAVSEAIFIHRAMGGPVLSASPCGCGASFRTAVERQRHASEAVIAAALPHLRARQIEVQTAIGHTLGRAEGRKEALEALVSQLSTTEAVGGYYAVRLGPLYHTRGDATEALEKLARDITKGDSV